MDITIQIDPNPHYEFLLRAPEGVYQLYSKTPSQVMLVDDGCVPYFSRSTLLQEFASWVFEGSKEVMESDDPAEAAEAYLRRFMGGNTQYLDWEFLDARHPEANYLAEPIVFLTDIQKIWEKHIDPIARDNPKSYMRTFAQVMSWIFLERPAKGNEPRLFDLDAPKKTSLGKQILSLLDEAQKYKVWKKQQHGWITIQGRAQ